MKLVEWNFQNPICNTVCQHSPCIIIDDNDGGHTRRDTRMNWIGENLTWHDWNN